MAFWKENDMKRFGVLLASAALAASGPAAAMGGLGRGHFGGFGGRSMAMGGFVASVSIVACLPAGAWRRL
jgi:hypothetical protein